MRFIEGQRLDILDKAAKEREEQLKAGPTLDMTSALRCVLNCACCCRKAATAVEKGQTTELEVILVCAV